MIDYFCAMFNYCSEKAWDNLAYHTYSRGTHFSWEDIFSTGIRRKIRFGEHGSRGESRCSTVVYGMNGLCVI